MIDKAIADAHFGRSGPHECNVAEKDLHKDAMKEKK